jgi:aspartyl-tRNA(Asn)/glutamyl-tRNA(Gln) amidotransferase subunit B
VERAIAFEIERQAGILDGGGTLVMETRGWSDDRSETYRMRGKETSDDYRYFPEPDLPPLRVDMHWLASIQASLPELPAARRSRYQEQLGLSAYDAGVLTSDPDAGRLFEATLAIGGAADAKPVANWVIGDYLRLRNAATGPITVEPSELATLIRLVADGELSRASGREVLEDHIASRQGVTEIVASRGLRQISDADALGTVIDQVLAANPMALADVRAGKAQAIGFLVGQVMKATRGQANAGVVQAGLRARIGAGEASSSGGDA